MNCETNSWNSERSVTKNNLNPPPPPPPPPPNSEKKNVVVNDLMDSVALAALRNARGKIQTH